MPNPPLHLSGKSLPSLNEVIEQARQEREGPPIHPLVVAYPHVLTLARGLLYGLVRDPTRQQAVLRDFDSRVQRIEDGVEGHATFGDQLLALEQVLVDADAAPIDLRSQRESRGPEDAQLLEEYEVLLPRLQRLFKDPRDSAARAQRRFQCRGSFAERAQRISVAFPWLSPEQASEASHDKPSHGAYVVLGAKYGLSAGRIRDRLAKRRKARTARARRR